MTYSSSDNSSDKPKKDFLSEAPAVVRFFFDKSKPLSLRAAGIAVVVLLLLYPVLASRPKNSNNSQHSVPEQTNAMTDTTAETLASEKNAALLEPAPEKEITIFQNVPNIFPYPIGISGKKNGDVWITSVQDVLEVKQGNVNQLSKKLDPAIFDRIFNNDLPAISAVSYADDGTIWLGSRDGMLLRYSNYDWKVVWDAKEPLHSEIKAIQQFGDNVFIGGKGLWRWNVKTGSLTRYPGFKGVSINAFLETANQQLFMAAKNGLWFLGNKGWQLFFAVGGQDKNAWAIFPDAERGFLLGTSNGLVRLSPAGIVLERALPGATIRSITADSNNNIWVGTKEGGLKFWDRKTWYEVTSETGLAGNYVEQVTVDSNNNIWIGIIGKGVYSAPVSKVEEIARKNPDASKPIDTTVPKIYASACKAAEEQLRAAKTSGGISTEKPDGEQTVFFNGIQVCPRGKGYRRADGAVVTLREWNVTVYSAEGRNDFQVPRDLPADSTNVVFLDSKNRVWLGFNNAGPVVLEAGGWNKFTEQEKLIKNPVQAITEDASGQIWIGTNPPFDKDSKEFLYPNLHRFDGSSWTHFSPHDGLGYWSTSSLLLLKNGELAVGTNGGLSIVKGSEITNYGDSAGLEERYVYSLSQDAAGDIWMGHLYWGHGVSWYNGSTFHNVAADKGLFNDRVSLIAHDDIQRVWLIGSNGSVGIYPRAFFDQKVAEGNVANVGESESSDEVGSDSVDSDSKTVGEGVAGREEEHTQP